MATQSAFFHALLRPPILQILRSTGYHSAKPSVVDSLTDIAARYLTTLCEKTASHAIHNQGDAADYTIVDVRLALQEVGALLPEKTATEQAWLGKEDTTGVDDFIGWFSGERMTELMEMGVGDGESDATDYLSGKSADAPKKHAKTAEDNKFTGTVIGRSLDTVPEILVEGGPVTSINEWIMRRRSLPANAANLNGEARQGQGSPTPTPSSGLSSVGSRLDDDDDDDDDMDLS
ncbi:Bromodomain associated domain protein [Metarhizium album ARSEF 1941]|uniref:Bromodomain associated domain protein n=1 Tax=Metarhizium album (strain ARSEF 1941) TaxID=1081103 RepID=A0A0B2WNV0_METAS|nr:Bromodomain associated domain protein [Metarhizium album ARSEF 1941]KHN95314.1 Bromodomain associated domain protein [Metarhizium album ARSEF 1941]